MKDLIYNLFKKLVCCHEWKLEYEVRVVSMYEYGNIRENMIRHYFCKKCGKYKRISSR